MTTLRDRLQAPDLRRNLTAELATAWTIAGIDPPGMADRVLALLELELLPPAGRQFIPAHLGVVYLLAEQAGATHSRLRRLWDAKASRATDPWPWISDSGLRTRCSELVSWGIVEATGARGESQFGRPSQIWSLVGVDPRVLGREVAGSPAGVADGTKERLAELLGEGARDATIVSQLLLVDDLVGIRRAAIAGGAS